MTAELDAWIVSTVAKRPGITLYELADSQLAEFPERYAKLTNPKQSARSRVVKRVNQLIKSGELAREKGWGVSYTTCHRRVWHYYIAEGRSCRP